MRNEGSKWFRVFGASELEPTPAAILEHLHDRGFTVKADFGGDEAGWFRADFTIDGFPPVNVERFFSTEEGIRAELNSWAAWIETVKERTLWRERFRNERLLCDLMERIIQTRQLFCFRSNAVELHAVCQSLAQFLAAMTHAVYQIDGEGLFMSDGALLVPEVE